MRRSVNKTNLASRRQRSAEEEHINVEIKRSSEELPQSCERARLPAAQP